MIYCNMRIFIYRFPSELNWSKSLSLLIFYGIAKGQESSALQPDYCDITEGHNAYLRPVINTTQAMQICAIRKNHSTCQQRNVNEQHHLQDIYTFFLNQ